MQLHDSGAIMSTPEGRLSTSHAQLYHCTLAMPSRYLAAVIAPDSACDISHGRTAGILQWIFKAIGMIATVTVRRALEVRKVPRRFPLFTARDADILVGVADAMADNTYASLAAGGMPGTTMISGTYPTFSCAPLRHMLVVPAVILGVKE